MRHRTVMNVLDRGHDRVHKKKDRDLLLLHGFPRRKEAVSFIRSMHVVVESPYEGTLSAEVGEPIFDQVKAYLDPVLVEHDDVSRRLEPSPKARHVWGPALAQTIVETSDLIASSGILYGAGWGEGRVHDRDVGRLPPRLLLLCLQEQRIGRSNTATCGRVVRDLDLVRELGRTLASYSNWRGKYLNLHQECGKKASVRGDAPVFLARKRLQCLKCVIFVLRAVTCIQVLKKASINESLRKKLEACLSILDDNCTVTAAADPGAACEPRGPAETPPARTSIGKGPSPPGSSSRSSRSSSKSPTTTTGRHRSHMSTAWVATDDSPSKDSGREEDSRKGVANSFNGPGGPSHQLMSTSYRNSRLAANGKENRDVTVPRTVTIARGASSTTTQRRHSVTHRHVYSDTVRAPSEFPIAANSHAKQVSINLADQPKATGEFFFLRHVH
jgi:hypothetical protein